MEVTVAEKIQAPGLSSDLPASPGLLDRTAWRDAALAWLGQRLFCVLLAYLGLWLLVRRPMGAPPPGPGDLYHIWTTWDAAIYGDIAAAGYTDPAQAAFFPLFPLLERMLAFLFGGNTSAAGLLVANAASLGAFGLLRVLAERELGRPAARRTLLALVIFPTAFFLVAAYTEALLLLLSVGAFLALRRGRWLMAGLLAALATLTRPTGILLLLPLTAMAAPVVLASWRDRDWRQVVRVGAALFLPLAALVGFSTYLFTRFGSATATLDAEQSAIWRHALSWPWDGLLRAGSAVLHDGIGEGALAGLDIGFTLLFLALALAALRRLPLAYGLYASAMAVVVLLTPTHIYDWAALASNGRYLLGTFPLFFVLAGWEDRRGTRRLLVYVSVMLLVGMTLLWGAGVFVG